MGVSGEEDGPILSALRLDLQSMPASPSGARRTLEAMALWLAAVADNLGTSGGATTTARVAQELRATLIALTKGDDDEPGALSTLVAQLSSAVRDGADTRARNARAKGGRGS